MAKRLRRIIGAIVVVLASGCAQRDEVVVPSVPDALAVAEPVTPEVRDDAAFRAWVESAMPPFDRMTPGARHRVVNAVKFVDGSLAKLDTGDLDGELTAAEAGPVYSAIGAGGSSVDRTLSNAEAARKRARNVPEILADGIEARVTRILLQEPGDDATRRYWLLFPARVFSADIATATPHELALLLRATMRIAFESPDRELLSRSIDAFERLAAQGQATRAEAHAMLRLIVSGDDIAGAVAFAAQHAGFGLQTLPAMVDSPVTPATDEAPGLLDLDGVLVRSSAPLDGLRIVVTSSPRCAFSRAAATAIPADPELGAVFARHGLWIASPELLIELDALREWNTTNPRARMRIATAIDRWPIDDFARTPVFHLLHDGKPIGEPFIGWPLDGSGRDRLVEWWRSAAHTKQPASR